MLTDCKTCCVGENPKNRGQATTPGGQLATDEALFPGVPGGDTRGNLGSSDRVFTTEAEDAVSPITNGASSGGPKPGGLVLPRPSLGSRVRIEKNGLLGVVGKESVGSVASGSGRIAYVALDDGQKSHVPVEGLEVLQGHLAFTKGTRVRSRGNDRTTGFIIRADDDVAHTCTVQIGGGSEQVGVAGSEELRLASKDLEVLAEAYIFTPGVKVSVLTEEEARRREKSSTFQISASSSASPDTSSSNQELATLAGREAAVIRYDELNNLVIIVAENEPQDARFNVPPGRLELKEGPDGAPPSRPPLEEGTWVSVEDGSVKGTFSQTTPYHSTLTWYTEEVTPVRIEGPVQKGAEYVYLLKMTVASVEHTCTLTDKSSSTGGDYLDWDDGDHWKLRR